MGCLDQVVIIEVRSSSPHSSTLISRTRQRSIAAQRITDRTKRLHLCILLSRLGDKNKKVITVDADIGSSIERTHYALVPSHEFSLSPDLNESSELFRRDWAPYFRYVWGMGCLDYVVNIEVRCSSASLQQLNQPNAPTEYCCTGNNGSD